METQPAMPAALRAGSSDSMISVDRTRLSIISIYIRTGGGLFISGHFLGVGSIMENIGTIYGKNIVTIAWEKIRAIYWLYEEMGTLNYGLC